MTDGRGYAGHARQLDIGCPGLRADPANARQDEFYALALAGAIAGRFCLTVVSAGPGPVGARRDAARGVARLRLPGTGDCLSHAALRTRAAG
jgi:hypothetical protein